MDTLEYHVIENDLIRIKVLPSRGCKISSMVYKNNNFEVFHQPQHEYRSLIEKYPKGSKGELFIDYDTSGCDDCIPTIDPCDVNFVKGPLNDHGEVWYKEFDIIKNDEKSLTCSTILDSMDIRFTKNIELEGNSVIINYEAKNIGDTTSKFMWSLHDLTVIKEGSYLDIPEPFSYINVQNNDKWQFDIRHLDELEDNSTYKFYYDIPLSEGKASVIYPNQQMKYTVNFDLEKLPYLGVWITTGGYKGEINLAIEPSTSYYDSLSRAIDNGTAIALEKNESFLWGIELSLDML